MEPGVRIMSYVETDVNRLLTHLLTQYKNRQKVAIQNLQSPDCVDRLKVCNAAIIDELNFLHGLILG